MKKYVQINWKHLLLSIIFSIIAAIFARVQFLKGDALDSALLKDLSRTLSYGLYLGLFIALELGVYYLYDLSQVRFIVNRHSTPFVKNIG